ncbi:MAG: hypothetical protein ACI9WU_005415, partial [Myxococcota bacterium]
MPRMRIVFIATCLVVMSLGGCSSDEGGVLALTEGADATVQEPDVNPESDPPAGPVFAEVNEAGITQYLGMAAPASVTEAEDGVFHYEWDIADGPMCLRGTPYRMAMRPTEASDDLLIFLGGGGACWSTFCFAFEEAAPGMPDMEALQADKETNPFKDFDVAFLSYCDGSLFAGDVEHDDDDDGTSDRFQYGLKNLSVALDAVAERYPDPDRLVLAGASGGGYGTIVATFLIRARYPDHELLVINDSGIGIAKGPQETEFVETLFSEFNAERFLPASCPDCLANGHLTELVAWQLDRDPDLKVAAFSYLHDFIIGTTFLGLGDAAFAEALQAETKRLHQRFPERYQYF